MNVYRCEVTTVLYVLAGDRSHAIALAERHAPDEDFPDVYVEPVSGLKSCDVRWRSALIYHDGTEDISMSDAFEIATPKEPTNG